MVRLRPCGSRKGSQARFSFLIPFWALSSGFLRVARIPLEAGGSAWQKFDSALRVQLWIALGLSFCELKGLHGFDTACTLRPRLSDHLAPRNGYCRFSILRFPR